ncbi:MAG TPA: hypothetical protein VKB79_10225 [Bryobacteraceae bacterium]|nr:hypothetical protein [Bryobacteraceae bacterium]
MSPAESLITANEPALPTGPTGPRTEAGKSISSKNALKSGLYTTQNFVLPDEVPEYEQSRQDLMEDLEPEGILEQTYADEILGAHWRLRRCRILEAALAAQAVEDESLDDAAIEKRQKSIDRARAQAHTVLRRSMAELRKLQTERHTRNECEIPEGFGIADINQILRAVKRNPAGSFCKPAAPAPTSPIDDPEYRRRETLRILKDIMKKTA